MHEIINKKKSWLDGMFLGVPEKLLKRNNKPTTTRIDDFN